MIKKIIFPIFMLLILIAGYCCYRIYLAEMLTEVLRAELGKYISALFLVSAGLTVQAMMVGFFGWYKAAILDKTKTSLDNELFPLVIRLCKLGIWIMIGLLVLPLFGINISALIATLGVGSLAIALAAKDTIANVIAGFMLMVDRPFREGDSIQLPSGELVTVLDVGIRRSKFADAAKKAVIILPNLELSKIKIVNLTYGAELERLDSDTNQK
jgi:MscS family membrane protein